MAAKLFNQISYTNVSWFATLAALAELYVMFSYAKFNVFKPHNPKFKTVFAYVISVPLQD